ncbi:MAG: hypothetical protein JWO41_354 [Candidatus Saccharibacteria bacterium]|nr:hypothetical protein [Candidatus Saccharibacteria bacterium]
MTKNQNHSKTLKLTIIICITLVLLGATGSWVYIQKQQIDQKNSALQQQKQLVEYQQEQQNKRDAADNKAKCQNVPSSSSDKFSGLFC